MLYWSQLKKKKYKQKYNNILIKYSYPTFNNFESQVQTFEFLKFETFSDFSKPQNPSLLVSLGAPNLQTHPRSDFSATRCATQKRLGIFTSYSTR